MKTIVGLLAIVGLSAAVSGAFGLAFNSDTFFGKVTFDYIMASALISIAASGVWLILNEQDKSTRSK